MSPSTTARSQPSATPIWAAIHTPFLATGELDLAGLRRNVGSYRALGLDGVFCNGLMGEVWSLTADERKTIAETIVDAAEGRLGVSCVISSSSLPETLELGEHAKRIGVTHAVLMVPTAGPRSDEQMFAYFRHICQRLDMPIAIFNAATAAGSPLTPALFARLCQLPGVKLLKTTAYGKDNAALRSAAGNGVLVSDPLEEHFLVNRCEHGQSILYADPEPYLYQTVSSRPIADYVALIDAGEQALAARKFEALAALRRVFNKWIMDPLIRGHMPNAALKHWCDLIGLVGGHVRIPVMALSDDEKRALAADLEQCHAPGLH